MNHTDSLGAKQLFTPFRFRCQQVFFIFAKVFFRGPVGATRWREGDLCLIFKPASRTFLPSGKISFPVALSDVASSLARTALCAFSTPPSSIFPQKIEKMFPAGPANSATLTKMHFVDILYERLGLSRSEASSVLEAIFDEVQAALVMGREVKLANFGTFATREKSARPGRNPRTGEEHVVSARRVVSFPCCTRSRYRAHAHALNRSS